MIMDVNGRTDATDGRTDVRHGRTQGRDAWTGGCTGRHQHTLCSLQPTPSDRLPATSSPPRAT